MQFLGAQAVVPPLVPLGLGQDVDLARVLWDRLILGIVELYVVILGTGSFFLYKAKSYELLLFSDA
jgi:hypothetical protein